MAMRREEVYGGTHINVLLEDINLHYVSRNSSTLIIVLN
jgi:hypothetical protein